VGTCRPFEQLDSTEQQQAVLSLLELRDDIALPDPRRTVPAMAAIATRHSRLNLLNIEAVAMGQILGATLWLSPETTSGALPEVLDQEHFAWQTRTK